MELHIKERGESGELWRRNMPFFLVTESLHRKSTSGFWHKFDKIVITNRQCSALQATKIKKDLTCPDNYSLNRLCLFLQFLFTEIKAKHRPESQEFSLYVHLQPQHSWSCWILRTVVQDSSCLTGGVLQDRTQVFHKCVSLLNDRHKFYGYCTWNKLTLEEK